MGKPSALNKDIPLRLPVAAATAVKVESDRLGLSDVEFIRKVLAEYFTAAGKPVDFSVAKPGGKRPRMTDQVMLNLVLARVSILKLPKPEIEARIGRRTYDLVWPEHKAAVEISTAARSDEPGWAIAHISPKDNTAAIDAALKALPL